VLNMHCGHMFLACKRKPYYYNIEHAASRDFKMMRNGAIGYSPVLVPVLHPSRGAVFLVSQACLHCMMSS
jgi:hypothetical protein